MNAERTENVNDANSSHHRSIRSSAAPKPQLFFNRFSIARRLAIKPRNKRRYFSTLYRLQGSHRKHDDARLSSFRRFIFHILHARSRVRETFYPSRNLSRTYLPDSSLTSRAVPCRRARLLGNVGIQGIADHRSRLVYHGREGRRRERGRTI